MACRDEYYGNEYSGYSAAQPLNGQFWMQIKEVERGVYPKPKLDYIPKPCQHCEDAPCIDAATGGAVYRREDGIVMIDPVRAKGQKGIVNACPYRIVYWNEELQIPQKCTMCAHRLDEGEKLPRCVESCPTGALVFGDLDDPSSEISMLAKSLPVEDLSPEFATNPLVKYVGLPKRLLTGEVVFQGREGECAQGVSVSLNGDGITLQTKTDLFGDFEFDGLPKTGRCTLTVTAEGYSDVSLEVSTLKDTDLGEIVLSPN